MIGWSGRILIKMAYIYPKYGVVWFLSVHELFTWPNIFEIYSNFYWVGPKRIAYSETAGYLQSPEKNNCVKSL